MCYSLFFPVRLKKKLTGHEWQDKTDVHGFMKIYRGVLRLKPMVSASKSLVILKGKMGAHSRSGAETASPSFHLNSLANAERALREVVRAEAQELHSLRDFVGGRGYARG